MAFDAFYNKTPNLTLRVFLTRKKQFFASMDNPIIPINITHPLHHNSGTGKKFFAVTFRKPLILLVTRKQGLIEIIRKEVFW